MGSDSDSYNNLLIVDDDSFILRLLTKMFKNHYNVKAVNNGLEAMKILEHGFVPGVILSDHIMPKMKGSEFLGQSQRITPTSTRILLTGHFETKELILAINESKAYYYITKPFIELDLLQAVKVGFDYHKNKLMREQAYSDAESKDREIKQLKLQIAKLSSLNKNFFFDTMSAFSNFISSTEKYYFTNHSRSVSEITSLIASKMKLRQDQMVNLELASKLHNTVQMNMPLKFKLIDPFDFTRANDYVAFQKYFNESVEIFLNTNGLVEIGKIIAQLYEHADGTGFPKALTGSNFIIEAQILSIVNIYHNMTYRLLPEQMNLFLEKGEVIQSKDETIKRHNRALRFIQNKNSYFERQVSLEFFELVNNQSTNELIPINRSLVISNDEFDFQLE